MADASPYLSRNYTGLSIEEALRLVAADLKDIEKVKAGAITRGIVWGEGAIARQCSPNVDRDDLGNSGWGRGVGEVLMHEMGVI